MSTQSPLIDLIFTKLTLIYGRDFTDRYAGLPTPAVKAEWAQSLGGYLNRPEAIRFALENLPASKPPTVLEFRALCARLPEYAPPRLPAPKCDRERVRRLLARAKDAVSHAHGGADWAHELAARAEAGEIRLTLAQREAIRSALGRKGHTHGEDQA